MTKYIINPLTGRKVKITGRIGMKLMLGGGIIGEGTYGVVYRPALKCIKENGSNPFNSLNNPVKNRDNYITKVYTCNDNQIAHNDRNDEGKELERVKSINQHARFHIKKEHDCYIHETVSDLYNRPASVFKYGGVTLYKIKEDKINPNVISKLYSLFEGLVQMGKHSILHFDIRDENIVYSEENGFKFIDFGLMFKPFENDETDKNRKEMIEDNEFYIWPWDIKYYVDTIQIKVNTEFKEKNVDFRWFINKPSYNYKQRGSISKTLGFIPTDLYEIVQKNIKESNYLNRLMKTADVYSLGVTLRRTPNIYNKMGVKTQELIQLMIHDDAFKRPLPEEAFRRFVDAMKMDHAIDLKQQQQQQRKRKQQQQQRKRKQQQRIKRLERERQQQRQQRQRQQIKRLFIKSGLGNICISNQ